MPSIERRISWRRWELIVISGIFFACFYLYVWLVIEPRLIYHAFGIYIDYPAFSVDWLFLKESLRYPGGPVEYISGFLSQWYYYSWAGALIITLIAWLICQGTDKLMTLAGGRWRLICYLPALGVLIIYNCYGHLLTGVLALLVALWFSIIYEKIPLRRTAVRAAVFLIMFVILYYIAGSVSLVFTALAGIYEIFIRRRLFLGGLIVLFGLAVPWLVGTNIFYLTIQDAYLVLSPFEPEKAMGIDSFLQTTAKCLYLFVPLVVLSAALWQSLVKARKAGTHSKDNTSVVKNANRFLQSGKFKLVLQILALVVVSITSIYFSSNSSKKKLFEMTYFSRQKMWGKVLEAARQMPLRDYDFFCNHQVNRALYHTGRLGNEMFSFPQSRSALLLFTADVSGTFVKFWMVCNTSLEMGNVNLAEQWAYETLELQGNCPFVLEKLALIYLVKGQTETARVFLNTMSKDLIYGNRAREILRRMEKDPKMIKEQQIQYLRSLMLLEDEEFVAYSEDYLLEKMLEANRHNKMAFEYLMAFYLLTRQPGKIVENLHRLEDFGYKEIPRHYEEAVMIYASMKKEKVPLRPQTIQRYEAFVERYKPLQRDKKAAFEALVEDFGGSYFFYYIFNVSGVTK